jgi:EF hand
MKTSILLSAALIVCGFAGSAFAADALDDAKCDAAWTMASPNGDTITKDQAVPYVIDFTMVDSDADGKISAEEFKKGCAAGAIKAANQDTTKDMDSGK